MDSASRMPPADARAYAVPTRAEYVATTVTAARTVSLAERAEHVAVYWGGNTQARVTLAFSSDGTHFGEPVDAGRDELGEQRDNGTTYGAIQEAHGAVAVRVMTDRPIPRLTVLGMSDGTAAAQRSVSGAPAAATAGAPDTERCAAAVPSDIPSTVSREIGRSVMTRTATAPCASWIAPYVVPLSRCSPSSSRPASTGSPKCVPSEEKARVTRACVLPPQYTATCSAGSASETVLAAVTVVATYSARVGTAYALAPAGPAAPKRKQSTSSASSAAASGDRRGRDRWLESPGPSATTATPSEVRGRHARCAVHTSFIALILLSNGDGELQRAPKPYTLAGVSEGCVRALDIRRRECLWSTPSWSHRGRCWRELDAVARTDRSAGELSALSILSRGSCRPRVPETPGSAVGTRAGCHDS